MSFWEKLGEVLGAAVFFGLLFLGLWLLFGMPESGAPERHAPPGVEFERSAGEEPGKEDGAEE